MLLISVIIYLMLALEVTSSSSAEDATLSSWPLTFTILSEDKSVNPPVFWAQLKLGDASLLPIYICGGWEIEVTFNQDVTILSNPASGYKNGRSTSTVHYFHNKDYDSVYVIESIGDKYINIEGETDVLETLTATVILEERYHPPVTDCNNTTTYTTTAPRWSGGSNLGGFSAIVKIRVEEEIIGGWEVEITFSEPLSQFSLSNVNINADSENKVYRISNCCHWNANFAVGTTIDLPITVQYDTDYCPDYCAAFASDSTTPPSTETPTSQGTTQTQIMPIVSSPSMTINHTTQNQIMSIVSSPSMTTNQSVATTSNVASQQQDSYFNRWQTIVIAVGPSVFALILLSSILFVYYCILSKDEDVKNEKLIEKELELSVNDSGIEMDGYHGDRKPSTIAVPGIA